MPLCTENLRLYLKSTLTSFEILNLFQAKLNDHFRLVQTHANEEVSNDYVESVWVSWAIKSHCSNATRSKLYRCQKKKSHALKEPSSHYSTDLKTLQNENYAPKNQYNMLENPDNIICMESSIQQASANKPVSAHQVGRC